VQKWFSGRWHVPQVSVSPRLRTKGGISQSEMSPLEGHLAGDKCDKTLPFSGLRMTVILGVFGIIDNCASLALHYLQPSYRFYSTREDRSVGFRVASVPEPC
jgi:hypothetical protein